MGLRERYDEVGAVRRRAQLGWEELSSQLVFLMPLIFIHFIRAALVQPILPMCSFPPGLVPDCPRRFSRTQCRVGNIFELKRP